MSLPSMHNLVFFVPATELLMILRVDETLSFTLIIYEAHVLFGLGVSWCWKHIGVEH
jgi:hypothetical protein